MSECEKIYRSVDGEASRSRPSSRQGDPGTVDLEERMDCQGKECHDLACHNIYLEKVPLLRCTYSLIKVEQIAFSNIGVGILF